MLYSSFPFLFQSLAVLVGLPLLPDPGIYIQPLYVSLLNCLYSFSLYPQEKFRFLETRVRISASIWRITQRPNPFHACLSSYMMWTMRSLSPRKKSCFNHTLFQTKAWCVFSTHSHYADASTLKISSHCFCSIPCQWAAWWQSPIEKWSPTSLVWECKVLMSH